MANELKSTKINGDLSVTGNVNVSAGTITGDLNGTASVANKIKINSTGNSSDYHILVSPENTNGADTPLKNAKIRVTTDGSGNTSLNVSGNVNGTYINGNGSGITNINAANIVGTLDSGLFSVTDKKEIATAVNGPVTIGTASQPLTVKASSIALNGPTTVNSDLKVNGNVNITGEANIGQGIKINGSTTIVDATTLSTGDTLIELGSGDRLSSTNPALASTQYAGFYVQKYDGEHSGALVFDNTGTAYVGDVQVSGNTISPIDSSSNASSTSLQPLATRVKNIAHNSIIKWDNNDKTLKPIQDGDIKSIATGDASNGNIAIVNKSGSYSSVYRTKIEIQDSVNIITSGGVKSSTVTASKISSEEIVNGRVQIAENTIVVKSSATGSNVNDVIRLDSSGNITASTAAIPNITGNLNGKATTAGTADIALKLNTNAGSTTQPIYFSNGVPNAITGAIANDTTGNAATATKLQTSRNFSVTGGATATAVAFNGTEDVKLNVTALNPTTITAGTIGSNTVVVDIRGTADKAKQVNISASFNGNFNIPYVSGNSGAQTIYAGAIPASLNSTTNLIQLGGSAKKVNINGQADTVNEKISLGENLSGDVSLIEKDSNNKVTLNAVIKEIGNTSSTANVTVNQSLNLLASKSLILQGANIPWHITNSSNALTFGSIDSSNKLAAQYVFGANSATFNQEIKANSNITVSDTGKISSKSIDLREGFKVRLFDRISTTNNSSKPDYAELELIQGNTSGTDYNIGLRLNRQAYSSSDNNYHQNNWLGDNNASETNDARIIPLIFSSENKIISSDNSSASGTILKYYKGAIVAAKPGTDYFSSEGSFAAPELESKVLPSGSINLDNYKTDIKTNNATFTVSQSNKLIGVLPFFAVSTATTDSDGNLYNFTLKPYVPESIITKTAADNTSGYMFNSNSSEFPVLTKAADTGIIKIDGTITRADALNANAGSSILPVYFENGIPKVVGNTLGNNDNKINISGAAEESKKLVEADSSGNLIGINKGSSTLPVYFANGKPVATGTTLGVSITGNAETATKATKATTAEKLGTSAGNSALPVYFSEGKPVATGTTLGVSITGNASTATKLQTARTISIKGGANTTASTTFDGSGNASITLTSGIITEALGFTPLKDSDAMSYRGSVTASTVVATMQGTRINGDVYLYNGDNITVGSSITGTTDMTIENGDMLVVYVSGNTKQWTVIERNNTDAVSFNGATENITENTLAYFKSSKSKDISNSSIKISGTTITANLTGNATTATTASKLNTNAGNASLPVYFSGGVPESCNTTLAVSITGNAETATTATKATTAEKLGTSAGNSALPVYFSGGKPVATDTTLDVSINGTAATSKKLISVDASGNLKDIIVGSSTQPIYFSNGVPVAISGPIANNTTGNAASASKLQNSRNFSITGGATASAVSFNGESNVALTVTALDPTKISAGNIGANVNLLGNAASASKLNTDAGNASLPVYFSGGVPVSCNTTLDVSITGNAKTATTAYNLNTDAGNASLPVYFSGGVPVSCNTTLAVSINGNASTASDLSKSSTGFIYQSASKTTAVCTPAANQLLVTDANKNYILQSYSSNVAASGNYIVLAVNGNFSASTITAVTFSGSLSGNAASASKLNITANIGSSTQPVYFSNGVPVAISGTISNNAASASKLNISTAIGSNAKPVYFGSNGLPVAISTTIGSASTPVYINGGTITAIDGTLKNSISGNAASATKLTSNGGSTIKPVYFSDGKPVQCAGPLQSPGFAIESNDNGTLTKRATISYNTTDQCIEFIFV